MNDVSCQSDIRTELQRIQEDVRAELSRVREDVMSGLVAPLSEQGVTAPRPPMRRRAGTSYHAPSRPILSTAVPSVSGKDPSDVNRKRRAAALAGDAKRKMMSTDH